MTHDSAWTCRDLARALQPLIDQRLDDAQRLRAQAHLDGCLACRARVTQWERLTELMRGQQPSPPREEERLLRRIEAALAQPSEASPSHRRVAWLAGTGAVLAAACWLIVARLPDRVAPTPALASVALDASGDAIFFVAKEEHAIRYELEQGTLSLEVHGLSAGDTVAVCTPQSCARVFGTVFSVTRKHAVDEVRVEQGVVAVAPREALDTFVVLQAGERLAAPWTLSAEALATLADAHVAAHRIRSAERLWRRIVHVFPSSAEAESATFQLGRAALEDRRAAEAERHLRDYLQAYPRGTFAAVASWQLALALIEEQQASQAAAVLDTLIATHPSSLHASRALFALASLYAGELADSGRAITLFRRYCARPDAERRREAQDEIARMQGDCSECAAGETRTRMGRPATTSK